MVDIPETIHSHPLMNIRTLLILVLLLWGLPARSQAASTLVVTTWGNVTTLTSEGEGYGHGYSFNVSNDSRFIRFVITKDQGELWGILLGVPQGQTLANGLYTSSGDNFDAYPEMWGAGFSIAGTDPETGLYGGATSTQGEFTLSDLHWGPNGIDAVSVRFGVHANGHQYGELLYNTAPSSVPEPGGVVCLLIGLGGIMTIRQRWKQ